MTAIRDSAFQCIIQTNGGKQSRNFQTSIEQIQQIADSEGLTESELESVSHCLTSRKLSSSICKNLLACFIPDTVIKKEILKKLLLWFFTERGSNNMSFSSEKLFFQWLTGIVYYDLSDISVVESYYYSFLFLLEVPHLEVSVCKLLCLISKPEDAKRWVVQQILRAHNRNGQKAHTNSLLSLLKSYKPEVVPERVPVTNVSIANIGKFDESFKRAHSRNLKTSTENDKRHELQWNSWQLYDNKKPISRLIPAPENLNLETGIGNKGKKLYSVTDLREMTSVAIHQLRIEYPAQTLSLLANNAGHHLLAFSDEIIKTRFSHKLHHILFKVYLLELVPYSEKEKLNFLRSLKAFQEYTLQNIPVVTTFLFNYFLIWDGESYREEILGLLEWIEIRNEEDLDKYVFPTLHQIFISSGTHMKCLIIETMGKLMKNLLLREKREKNYFEKDYAECDLVKSVEAIASFVGRLIRNGLIWNNEKKSRNILMTSIDFYEVAQAVERAGDLPIIFLMPPSLVYKCLFSGSRVCVARLCSLLIRLQVYSVERLFLLGVFQDFSDEVQQLRTYLLDYYRCLWSHVTFLKNEESFLFHEKIFSEMFWAFKQNYGDIMETIFGIGYSTFWIPQTNGLSEDVRTQIVKDFPSVLELKQVVEEHLLKK